MQEGSSAAHINKTQTIKNNHTESQPEELKVATNNEVLEDMNWYELRVEGKQPERRAHHSSFVIGTKMYIYGGYDIREGPLKNVWSFDASNVGQLANQDLSQSKQTLRWVEVPVQGVKQPGT